MTNRDILDVLVDLRDRGEAHVVATVVGIEGSVSADKGAKAVFDADGRLLAGWVGGGCADSAASAAAREVLTAGEGKLVPIDMDDEILGTGVPCGGSMQVWVEPMLPRPSVWLLGQGRLVESLCRMATVSGFDVIVDDPRATTERFPDAVRVYTDDLDYSQLQPRRDDFVVVATQHKGDHHSVSRALNAGAGYIALVASRKRARLVLESLRGDGFTGEQLEAVVAPAGLDLGGRSPEEIALAILGEMVLLRHGGTGQRLKDRKPL
ncbi:XdhC family protein [Aquisalimonas sp. 2447]|uniref:XdhC family protein n=1 Tax=Aquisalimonas sp. 2447 TaxID=2740807 RepID=UPI001432792F|nr:XdhC family protein [Aquisalimonas sp. 2447]QIT56220.1 XdhC family protein [Aquisalimonas sp. 2447]